jgi:YD repeat-containing protein
MNYSFSYDGLSSILSLCSEGGFLAPGIGINSSIDVNGLRIIYKYDELGRLICITYGEDNDDESNLPNGPIMNYEYHYRTQ